MKKKNPPLHKNQILDITISSLGPKGDGIAFIGTKKVIIPNTLPNERVTIKLIKLKRHHIYAKCLQIKQPSPHRQEPVCPVSSQCGGCESLHVTIPHQLHLKWQSLLQKKNTFPSLTAITLKPIMAAEKPLFYRNKAQFIVKKNSDSDIAIGLYAKHSHRVINIDQCYIQHPLINQTLTVIKQWLHTTNLSFYNEDTHNGLIRHIVIRVAPATKQVMVAVVSTKKIALTCLIKQLEEQLFITSILLNINPDQTDTILGHDTHCIWGKPTITDQVGTIKTNLSLQSFAQSNAYQTNHLYNLIRYLAKKTPKARLWDLYTGVGTIGLQLTAIFEHVIGIDESDSAIANAKQNAILNKKENITFIRDDVTQYIKKETIKDTDTVIIDPPRKGCGPAFIELVTRYQPSAIIYVSCNPNTLWPELNEFITKGYDCHNVYPVDMFPQTNHIECVTLLTRATVIK
ncbi:23S rRNA (uracil(1939)-C(5))-methyltransferase RlmD [Candidatus Marinamargulisbacteria bacterium SCGC AG-410-N11]|nr:23S rRNA (uracil(1939)-C(5))-methyltransferase RlmD [Candidatus Marinamargulisbacteria bacterium SCGC AG-410-N11]